MSHIVKRESLMLEPVAAYLDGKTYHLQKSEQNFYEYRVDLYGFSDILDSTIAVELKISNWRRAVKQTLIYQLCSDFVVIAMPEWTIGRVDENILSSHGIGLILVLDDGRCDELISPMQSTQVRPHYRSGCIESLKVHEKETLSDDL